jgi:hypothetical protein
MSIVSPEEGVVVVPDHADTVFSELFCHIGEGSKHLCELFG